MSLYKLRPSSIGDIMTEPKSKTEVLSVGAKTYLKKIAQQIAYGFEPDLDNKYLRKGIQCEDQSIELLNLVYFKDYKKNSGRVENELMSGECDILTPNYIRDVKTSWSLETFPALVEDGEDKIYEYQGRAYMYLYDRPEFRLDYCMVTTPEDMRKYESAKIHEVDHIPPELRVTTVIYHRDMELENRMLEKAYHAQRYIEEIKARILTDHNYQY